MRRRGFLGLSVLLATLILLSAAPMSSNAGDAKRDRAIDNEIWKSDVIYYSASDTYFQLIDDKQTHRNGIDWSEAASLASKMSYRGRKGRLAIIDVPDKQARVMEAFNFSLLNYGGNTWIGLIYMCSTRKLVRVDGNEHPRSAFSFWDVPWHREDGIRCDTRPNLSYMGVYIHGSTNRWQATGWKKRFPHYIVEYPPK